MPRGVLPLDLPGALRAADVDRLLGALVAVLDGAGPALLPLPPAAGRAVLAAAGPDEPVVEGAALLLATSGSTGALKVVELEGAALLASARASQTRLGGPAQWLLALPLEHVAGWQVLVRSLVAGTTPVTPTAGPGASPDGVAAAIGAMTGTRRCAALVPTQLARLLADDTARAALADLDAVLLGGASAPTALLDAARAAGVAVVTSYGGTETAGGCVYDGVPLDGVRLSLDQGRVAVTGPVLARGYRGRPDLTAAAFVERGGRRWFATADLGRLEPSTGPSPRGDGPRLRVLGRADDVLVTGGENVAPAAVEEVLAGLDGVQAVVVVGVPDPEWGQAVTALVVPAPDAAAPTPAQARSAVRERLGPASAPRHVLVVQELPALALGKPDRRGCALLAGRLLAGRPSADQPQ